MCCGHSLAAAKVSVGLGFFLNAVRILFDGSLHLDSFGRFLEGLVREKKFNWQRPGFSHTQTYLMSLCMGVACPPDSYARALLRDDATKNELSMDMPRSEYKQVYSPHPPSTHFRKSTQIRIVCARPRSSLDLAKSAMPCGQV